MLYGKKLNLVFCGLKNIIKLKYTYTPNLSYKNWTDLYSSRYIGC